jgi:hypothetical protein
MPEHRMARIPSADDNLGPLWRRNYDRDGNLESSNAVSEHRLDEIEMALRLANEAYRASTAFGDEVYRIQCAEFLARCSPEQDWGYI